MRHIFSFTIECDIRGKLTSWSQTDGKLSEKDLVKFQEIRKRVESICRPTVAGELKFETEKK